MLARVLGAAAGGGFPQWNCGCSNCRGVREGTIHARPRTQAALAVSADGRSWFLFGASPDVRTQIEGFPALHPRGARHTPIAGIVLAHGDLDQCLGLLQLREAQPLTVYATATVRRSFCEGNALYQTLARFPGQVTWRELVPDRPVALSDAAGRESGLVLEAVPVPGKPPLHRRGATPETGDTVGLLVRETAHHRTLAYLPSVAGPTPELESLLTQTDALFFDGTFWSGDELVRLDPAGPGGRPATEMAHWPLSGENGSLALLARLPVRRRILIHINNTNPILREDSPEHRLVEAAGVEVAWDGMEVFL
jgi:pyrroloquinoline quinone biosynthesis protein B